MASRVAVAIEKEDAIKRIDGVLGRIAQESGQEYAPLPTQGKDADIVTKNQLVHLADALERLLSAPVIEALEGEDAEAAHDTGEDAPASDIEAQIEKLTPKGRRHGKS